MNVKFIFIFKIAIAGAELKLPQLSWAFKETVEPLSVFSIAGVSRRVSGPRVWVILRMQLRPSDEGRTVLQWF
jgi:hypothetical protein